MNEALAETRIDKVYRPAPGELLFKFKKSKQTLFLSASVEKGLERVHLLPSPPSTPSRPDPRTVEIRNLLVGGRVESVDMADSDRIVVLSARFKREESETIRRIIFELIPSRGNIIITEGEKVRLRFGGTSGVGRPSEGEDYSPPEAPEKEKPGLSPETDVAVPFPANAAAAELYESAAEEAKFRTLETEIRRALKKQEKRLEGKKSKLEKNLLDTEKADKFKMYGELLKNNLHNVKRGQASATLPHYTEKGVEEKTVPLDKTKSPEENMKKYFKKYKKLVRGEDKIKYELSRLEGAFVEMEEAKKGFKACENSYDLARFKKDHAWLMPKKKTKGPQKMEPTGPRKFVSSDGFLILMGRGDAENDHLTIRMARGNDVFLHASGWPGSHVIIRNQKDREMPFNTIVEAARIAAHYSKARHHSRVDVSYTPRKYVSKPRGAKPGLVTLSRHKTVTIKPDPGIIRDLKETSEKRLASGEFE